MMTVLHYGYFSPKHNDDKERQALNGIIQNDVFNSKDEHNICLVVLTKIFSIMEVMGTNDD